MKKLKTIFLIGGITAGAFSALRLLRGSSKEELTRITMIAKEKPTVLEGLRGKLYFEIFTVYRDFKKYKIGVYNTIGKGPIPVDEWDNFDTEIIKKELGAVAAIKNGPRYWVLDSICGYYAGETRKFYGYELDLVANIERTASQISEATKRENYSESSIERFTDWNYSKDKKVYELLSDDGIIYTMQSASLEINKDQKVDDLDSLGSKLKLPVGWSYRVRIPDNDATYKIRGNAHVIQDDFRNSYQRNPGQ